MELSELEQLALGTDRATALAALMPHTTEHDYWRGVLLQHEGRLDEVDALLAGWAERYGGYEDDFHTRLSRRQLIAKAQRDLPAVAEEILEQTGTSLDDRAEVVVQAQRFPTVLDPARLDDRLILQDAVRRRANLDDVTDALIPDLVRTPSLIPGFNIVRRTILQRLSRVDVPGTLDLVIADFPEKDGSNDVFGALPLHSLLTLAQLETLATRLPQVRVQSAWVDAMLARLAPPAWVDVRTDREERARVIDRAYAFAETLAPTFNTLKATLLYQRLQLDRAAGIFDRARFRAYVELPRHAAWVPRTRVETIQNNRFVQPDAAAANVLGLEPIGDDEPLLRDFLSRFLLEDDVTKWSDVLDSDWLFQVAAVAQLLAGATGEPWTQLVGAGREALKNRVDIDLAPQNRPWFGANDDVTLDVDVKNIRELEVKVFRIDTLAYWLAKNAEVDTSIDLDGMVPSGQERKLTFDALPIRRHRERIELPECKRPGTYVVELIGNGRSSRALIRKGTLRHLVRPTAAGLVVTVTDEDGRFLPATRLWLGGRELAPRDPVDGGGITVPFATAGTNTPVLLVHGDITQRAVLERPIETPQLSAGFHVERESLVANQTARVLACPRLTLGGAPASLALLENARVDISVSLLDGTSSSRTQPVVLRDDEDLAFDLPIPEGAIQLTLTLNARVRIASRQETVDVTDGAHGPLNVIHTTERTATLHLARVADQNGERFLLSLLGKTGEPLAGRAVALSFEHRAIRTLLQVTLETNDAGVIELGALDGKITSLTASIPNGAPRSWTTARAEDRPPGLVHALEGETITLPRPAAIRSIEDLTLMEHRRGANAVDLSARLVLVDRCVTIEGLPAGEYRVDFQENSNRKTTFLIVAPRVVVHAGPPGAAARAWVAIRDVLMEQSSMLPLLRRFEVEGDELVLRLANATTSTRAHFIATRFVADGALVSTSSQAPRAPQASWVFRNAAYYVSGRDIGDEYRYVLERRNAPRRPGTMLEKPSLLLHPWARQTTETVRLHAALGGAYGMPAPPPGAPMPAQAMRSASRGRMAKEEAAREEPGFPSLDFLPASAPVLENLRPDESGIVRVPLASLGPDVQRVEVFVADPSLATTLHAEVALPARPARARDLRLRLALDPARHFHEQRRIDGVPAGTTLVVPDVRTGKIELIGTLARAHQLLVTRMDDASSLQEFSFVTEWSTLDEATRRARYSKYACHELNLYLWRKDSAFFESTIRPSLAHKREKSVVDRFLLGEDLSRYLEAWAFGRLNTLERILVAASVPDVRVSLARLVGDAVDLLPPDPEGDAQLVATLLGAASLEVGGGAMANAAAPAAEIALMEMERSDDADESSDITGAASRDMPKMKKADRRELSKGSQGQTRAGGGGGFGGLAMDMLERDGGETLYRGAEKTQEWAEVQWWKRRIEEIDASLIEPNRFWRDLATYVVKSGLGTSEAPFLSPHIGQCQRSFAEAMCALAFLDLPFVAVPPDTTLEDTRFTLTAKSHALAASSSLVEIEAPEAASTVLIGQSYVRSDDRWEWHDGEQREKRVTGELITGVVYRCLVVVTNPTSATEKLEVLLQIPKGAIPVDTGFITRTVPVSLDPYGTESFDYAFYFPSVGQFTHFPAHVTRNSVLVAFAPARELAVVREPSTVDLASWSHVSQHGTLDDVLGFLRAANLGRIEIGRIAWRMHDAEAFRRITDLLAARHVYEDGLWAYALLHRDRRRVDEWLRHQDDFLRPGALLDGFLDPTERGWYQHLEYAPLINARAHRLGAERRIPNTSLDAQYRAFLDFTAHRAKLTADDLLVAAHYQLAMDRVEDAILLLERVREDAIGARVQYDYLTAYVAGYRGDVAAARTLAARWVAHPVDRWRNRFVALAQMIDEIGQTEKTAGVVDPDSRDQKMADAAARQPSLDIAVRGGDITLTHANLAQCQLRFFKLDIELVFSRQPFVQSDVERFSFIEPGWTVDVALGTGATTTVSIPAALKGANIVIEAVAPGLRRSVAHYAHDLGVQVAHSFGQLKVVRASTGAPLPSVYVKVYSRERGGRVVFYKDGYTDLRGRIDYVTLSTDDLDRTERFALLVASDDAGATIVEAPPPAR